MWKGNHIFATGSPLCECLYVILYLVSQKEITINNFSSSTKNFYKSYHMNTKIINNNIEYDITEKICLDQLIKKN